MSFSIKEALTKGWTLTKEHFWKLVAITFAFFLAQIILSIFVDSLTADGGSLEFIATFAVWLVSVLWSMGLIRVALNVLEDKEFDVITLFSERVNFWNFLWVSVLQVVIMAVGLILFVIPGIIWALMFSQAQYLVVDKGLTAFEALKESKKLMQGFKWHYLGFILVVVLINLVGVLVVGIGLLVTVPVTMIASLYVYNKLNEHAYALSEEVKNDVPVTVEG